MYSLKYLIILLWIVSLTGITFSKDFLTSMPKEKKIKNKLEILSKYNINAYMVTSIEGNGIRASVLYEDNGEMFIANPVEDIEYFTEKKIRPEDRYKYFENSVKDLPKGNLDRIEYGLTPYTRPPYTLVADNFIVSGDAGNLNKPLNGEGITSAKSFTRQRRCVMADAFRII